MKRLRRIREHVATTIGCAAVTLAAVVAALVASAGPVGAVAISAPPSASLGTVSTTATSITAQIGPVMASAAGLLGLLASFDASVSTTAFVTGSGSAYETIPKTSIYYWSGPATATGPGNYTPGQPTAADKVQLNVTQHAFSGQGSALLQGISATWYPTIVINLPSALVAGTYTATITHSVA